MANKREYLWIHEKRFNFIKKRIAQLSLAKNAQILDVGCYPLYLFNDLSSQGYQLTGIASHHESIRQKNIAILDIEKEIFPFADDTFHLVIFTEVIEHLITGHHHVIKEIFRVLKPNGFVLVTTPNVHRLSNIISLILTKNIYFPLANLNDNVLNYRHNREFTLTELNTIFKEVGFKSYQSAYFNSLKITRLRSQPIKKLLTLGKFILISLTTILPVYRDSLLVIFKKPTLSNLVY